MQRGKKFLLCVTGSIAAYKAVFLLRLLIKQGSEVRVIMTDSASDFVAPLTFSTLSSNKVLTNLFDDDSWANHVMLGRWADAIVIAPATCNTVSKMAHGICDNLLLAVYLSATVPVIVAPAMDEDMWYHPASINNLRMLKERGHHVLKVNDGELASGLHGMGRMAEPEEILAFLDNFFENKLSLKGKTALVTAGPTYESIDPVRFIGNHSSGKMGIAIAKELAKRGAEVRLILGPTASSVNEVIAVTNVVSADDMYKAVFDVFANSDIIIMAAAVADFTPNEPAKNKIKKEEGALNLNLVKTKDILLKAGELKSQDQILVGFALETENEKQNALKKLAAKKADMIVLNSLNDEGAGFGSSTNKISIFEKNGAEHVFEKKSKEDVAVDIVNVIVNYKNE